MSITRRHGLYGVQVDSALIGGIQSHNMPINTTLRAEARSSEAYARFISLVRQSPTATFSTVALGACLDAVGITGVGIKALTAGVTIWAQKFAAGGTRAGITSHRKVKITDGILVPRKIGCEFGGDAVINCEAIIGHDGTNDPIIPTDAQTLPAGIADNQVYTLGKVTVGGVTLDHLRGVDIDPGITVEAIGGDADVWPTFVSIVSIKPTIRLRGIDIEWFKAANIPLLGKAATHANTSIYLRKRADAGTFVLDATAQHIKFTADGLAYIEDPLSSSGSDPTEASLVLECRHDGTNMPITVNTASAIT